MRLDSHVNKPSGCPAPNLTAQIPASVLATHTGPTGESTRAYANLVFTLFARWQAVKS
jgi:hypothetical protein